MCKFNAIAFQMSNNDGFSINLFEVRFVWNNFRPRVLMILFYSLNWTKKIQLSTWSNSQESKEEEKNLGKWEREKWVERKCGKSQFIHFTLVKYELG